MDFLHFETSFGLHLLQAHHTNESLIFSPLSIASALSVVQSDTQPIFHGAAADSEIVKQYSSVLSQVKTEKGLSLVNQIFSINHSLISPILVSDQAELNYEIGDSEILLINSISFTDDWKFPFDSANTENQIFIKETGSARRIPFLMDYGNSRLYSTDDDFEVLQLDYVNCAFKFVIFLSKQRSEALEDSLEKLTAERVQKLLKNAESKAVNMSLFGFLINCFLFYKLFNRAKTAFLKYCLAKTVPNLIVCAAFLFWALPLTALSIPYHKTPHLANVLIGQTSGIGAYVAGAFFDFFVAVNRCSAISYPMHEFKFANFVILIVFLVSTGFTLMGFVPEICGLVYDADILIWRPESLSCVLFKGDHILYTIVGISGMANTFNFITFIRLYRGRVDGISRGERTRRQKRTVRLFVQSVIQNFLHIIDMLNFNFIARLDSATWFQFTFNSMSLLGIHTLDGLVMYILNSEVRTRRKKNRTVVVINSHSQHIS
uniref:7TM GPCR serpentine receptor class x (Srx) domain-containing protein n=1 Tax=Caenorhabditis japonica TaxID=281687 RepID=A0A8R1HS65_CAEJA